MKEFSSPDQKLAIDNISRTKKYDPVARIVVIGVGGAGNNAINRMVEDNVLGVEFVGINTDKQDLNVCKAPKKVAIGEKLTGGRGCGALPEVGEAAANESREAIRNIFRENENQKKADMVFITCGMGGGTGTGAVPIIASLAKEEGILTVAVVTKPFRFEGRARMSRAMQGINKLYPNVDTLIIIPNDKLFQIVEANDGFKESFAKTDEVLKQSIKGITDLINLPALVNLDFADISTVMRNKGLAHIAIGEGNGDNRVINAIKKAIDSPLLETTIDGATDLILSIQGHVSLMDVDAAMREIEPKLSPDVNIIIGAREDSEVKDTAIITLIATGIKDTNTSLPFTSKQSLNNQNSMLNMPNIQNYNMNQNNFGFDNRMMQQNQNMNNQMPNTSATPQNQGISSFLGFKNKKSPSTEDNYNTNLNSGSKNIDSLNLDFSKLDFAKNDNNNGNTLLPNFLTDNFKNNK